MLNNAARNLVGSATQLHTRVGEVSGPPRPRPDRAVPGACGPSPARRLQVAPEKVLQSFNTWAFKREQPSDPQLMLQVISGAILHSEPIPFVLYWGKGPRCTLDQPEIQCLSFLASLAGRVGQIYQPGATATLVFTDTHATLNGHSPESMRAYFEAVDAAARKHGFQSCWLSNLTPGVEAEKGDEASLSEEMLRTLSESARKWYRGEGTAEQGALEYYRLNMIEKRAVELAFPRSIFVTFNGSEFRSLFPEHLPIFYMYTLRRGYGVKPWFLPASASDASPGQTRHDGAAI